MAEHPIYLPFTFTENSWQFTTIYDAKQDVVCQLDLENWHVTEDNQGALEEDLAKLVKFIVTAVNNHEALVKALSESRAALIAFKDAVEASQKMNGREYVGLGIQINNAIANAWGVLNAVGGVGK